MSVRATLIAFSATAALLGGSVGLSAPAHAIGCLSGGAAGAVAGHMAHHGVLGAVGGCIAGHEYHKHQKRVAADRARHSQERDMGGDGAMRN